MKTSPNQHVEHFISQVIDLLNYRLPMLMITYEVSDSTIKFFAIKMGKPRVTYEMPIFGFHEMAKNGDLSAFSSLMASSIAEDFKIKLL